MTHIPEGFAPITPYFLVEDPRAFIDFLKAAFGAEERLVSEDEGRIAHAEVSVFGSVLEIGCPKGEFTATRMNLHVYVTDPDAVLARAIQAGAAELYPAADHDYGERSGGVSDRWSNQWYIAKVTDHKKRNSAE